MGQNAKRRAGRMLIAAVGLVTAGLGGCSSSGFEKDSDNGWLSGYQADKNNDGVLSRARSTTPSGPPTRMVTAAWTRASVEAGADRHHQRPS